MIAAWIFAAAFLWPLLHVIGRTYEGIESLMLPAFVQIPLFFFVHILALWKFRSENQDVRTLGKRALKIVWGSVAVFWAILFILACASAFFEKRS